MQVSALDRDHNSVLHVAAYYGNAAAIQALLESGKVEAGLLRRQSTNGQTAIEVAAMRGFEEVVEILRTRDVSLPAGFCVPSACKHVMSSQGDGEACEIDVLHELNFKIFHEHFWQKQQPFLLRNALKGLKQDWSKAASSESKYAAQEFMASRTVTGKRNKSFKTTLHDLFNQGIEQQGHAHIRAADIIVDIDHERNSMIADLTQDLDQNVEAMGFVPRTLQEDELPWQFSYGLPFHHYIHRCIIATQT